MKQSASVGDVSIFGRSGIWTAMIIVVWFVVSAWEDHEDAERCASACGAGHFGVVLHESAGCVDEGPPTCRCETAP